MAQYDFNFQKSSSKQTGARGGSAMRGKNIMAQYKKSQDDLYNAGYPGESPFKTMY